MQQSQYEHTEFLFPSEISTNLIDIGALVNTDLVKHPELTKPPVDAGVNRNECNESENHPLTEIVKLTHSPLKERINNSLHYSDSSGFSHAQSPEFSRPEDSITGSELSHTEVYM